MGRSAHLSSSISFGELGVMMKGRWSLRLVSLLGSGLKGAHQKLENRVLELRELLDLRYKVFGIGVTCSLE